MEEQLEEEEEEEGEEQEEEEEKERKRNRSRKGTDKSESENSYTTHIIQSSHLPQFSLPRNITRLEPMYPELKHSSSRTIGPSTAPQDRTSIDKDNFIPSIYTQSRRRTCQTTPTPAHHAPTPLSETPADSHTVHRIMTFINASNTTRYEELSHYLGTLHRLNPPPSPAITCRRLRHLGPPLSSFSLLLLGRLSGRVLEHLLTVL